MEEYGIRIRNNVVVAIKIGKTDTDTGHGRIRGAEPYTLDLDPQWHNFGPEPPHFYSEGFPKFD